MAAGAVFSVSAIALANNGFMDLRPGSGEVVIHTISPDGAWELYWYDGTNSIKVDSGAQADGRQGLSLHCTATVGYRVKNVSGGAANFAADGMATA